MEKRFSTSRTAQILDVSTNTLKRWYMWYENDSYEKPADLKLPQYTTDKRRTKFFTMADIQVLEQFKVDLKGKYRGIMSDFNADYQWGQYGTVRTERKKRKKERQ